VAQEITKDKVPEIVIESVKAVNSAPSNETFVQRLIQNEDRIDQVTGNSVAMLSPNLASVNIMKAEDTGSLPSSSNFSSSSTNSSSSAEFLAFELQQLIDSNGNRLENIDRQPWKISGPESIKRDGLSVQKYLGSGNFNITSRTGLIIAQTNVEVTIELFSEAGSVKYGNSFIRVFPGSVKFSYKISRWPFTTVSDRLYLGIRSVASGNGGVYTEGDRLKVGDGFIETPFIAQADGADVPIKVFYEKNSSNEAYLLFEFPSYFSTLYYDPVASLSSNPFSNVAVVESSSWFSGMNIIYVSCGAAALVLGTGIFAFVLHRKRSRSRPVNTKTTQLVYHPKTGKNGAIAF
jgi:hypothetical protein